MQTIVRVGFALACSVAAATALAQAPARRLTTVDALRRFPGYYHLQNVLVRGEFLETGARIQFRSDERDIDVSLADGVRTTAGGVDVRGQLIDVGRLEQGDPRLAAYAPARDPERWPRPGEELFLSVTGVGPVSANNSASVRNLALEPWKHEGQTVTVVGQFRGRNLFGDLPAAPAKSRYDFVLRSGDGVVWVTGLRPRGRGFDLNVDARADTSQWLEVTGVVRRERSLVAIEATRIVASAARAEATAEEPAAPPAPPSPVEVVFSSPTPDETDVPSNSVVRVQFSRGLNPATIPSGFTVAYVGGDGMPILFQTSYDIATRAVEIRFAQPLTAFRTVKVELRDELKGFDGASVTAWSLTFVAGS